MTPLPLSRWAVATVFAAGSVAGMLILHCADPPRPHTTLACQSLVWGAWAAEQNALPRSAPILVSSARQLVSDIRRCAGLSTTFVDDTSHDPFGIERFNHSPPPDGGIYRSRQ